MESVYSHADLVNHFHCLLERADILNGKYTLFGKVEGTTVYNLMKIGQLEVNPASDRPLHPPKITHVEVGFIQNQPVLYIFLNPRTCHVSCSRRASMIFNNCIWSQYIYMCIMNHIIMYTSIQYIYL